MWLSRTKTMLLESVIVVSFAATLSHASAIARRASSVDDCPGYTASNVQQTASSLTADLKLAGSACNVYGTDIADLKLQVDYQTGKTFEFHSSKNGSATSCTSMNKWLEKSGIVLLPRQLATKEAL